MVTAAEVTSPYLTCFVSQRCSVNGVTSPPAQHQLLWQHLLIGSFLHLQGLKHGPPFVIKMNGLEGSNGWLVGRTAVKNGALGEHKEPLGDLKHSSTKKPNK